MKQCALFLLFLLDSRAWGSPSHESRAEAEYYVAAYSQHYAVPIDLVRAIVEQESSWQRCAVSRKGAVGLMQLMPNTARRLGVGNRCDLRQNVSGGVRYLVWLRGKFHGDLRLVAAAYYAGEGVVAARGLHYGNREVIKYVASIRERVEWQRRLRNRRLLN